MVKRYLEESRGVPAQDVITHISPLKNVTTEREGYPTQKPEALLELFIKASTDQGAVVLDPFCGCGTTVAVAHRLQREWIGIDISPKAVEIMKRPPEQAKRSAEDLRPPAKPRRSLETQWTGLPEVGHWARRRRPRTERYR